MTPSYFFLDRFNHESESESHSVVSYSLQPHGLYNPWNSPGQNTGVGSHSLLQGIFPTQGLNPGLPHCRQILYQLSHKGSPRTLDWQPLPSPADLPDPRIKPGSPALQVDSSPTELSGKHNPIHNKASSKLFLLKAKQQMGLLSRNHIHKVMRVHFMK